MAEWWEEYTAQPAAQPASQDGNWWDAYAADFGNVESGSATAPRPLMASAQPTPDPDATFLGSAWRANMAQMGPIFAGNTKRMAAEVSDPVAALMSGTFGKPESEVEPERPMELSVNPNGVTSVPAEFSVPEDAGRRLMAEMRESPLRSGTLRDIQQSGIAQARRGGTELAQAQADIQIPESGLERYAKLGAVSALPTLTGVAAGVITRSPAIGAGVSTMFAVPSAYGEAREAGHSVEDSIKYAGVVGGAEAISERLGFDAILGKLAKRIPAGKLATAMGILEKSVPGRALSGAAVEGTTEALSQAAQNAYKVAGLGEHMTLDEFQSDIMDSFGAGAMIGGPLAGGVRAVENVAGYDQAPNLIDQLERDANRIRTPESDAVDAGRETARAIFAEADAAVRPDPATIDFTQPVFENREAAIQAERNTAVPIPERISPDFIPERKPEKTVPTRLAELEAKPEPTLFEREEMALLQEGKPFDRQALLADLESAPEPELIRNGTRVFYPGDVKAMRAKLAEAGLSEGMRMTGEDGSDAGLYFPARLRAEVDAVLRPKPAEQAQPEPVKEGELPYRELGIPPPRKPRNRVKSAADFDPNYHDIRDFIALHGGLDAKAFAAEFNSEVPSPAENFRFFGKPLFRKSGGLQPDQLRELLQETGFLNPDSMDGVARYTPQDAYDLVDRALDGNPVYHSDGVETQNAIQNYNNEYADLSRRQEYIDEHGVTPELDEEFARRADAMDRGDLEPVFSKRAKDRTATPDMFGATQRAQTTPTPRPASGDLFGAPTPRDRLDAAQRDSDARLTGPAVGMRQGDGELFAGPRPRQETIPPRSSSAPSDPTSWILRDKATGKAVMETADRRKVDALNTQKYEAVPAEQHMQEVNTKGTLAYDAARGSGIKRSQRPAERILPVEDMRTAPLGAWVRGNKVPGVREADLFQVMDVPLDRINAPELDSSDNIAPERRLDAEDYTNRLRNGEVAPNARGYELPSGLIKLADGHRRMIAARNAGRDTLRIAVSPIDQEGVKQRLERPDAQGIEVDEAADLTPEELAAFERQTAPKHPERTRPDTPIIADDNVTTGLTGIARNEDAFKHPTSKAKTLPDILRDIEPGYTASESVELGRRNVEPADTAWNIRTPDGNDVQVYQKGDTVWIDVSNLKQGQAGSRIYNAVANYAHNTKRVFVGDPAGFSEVAQKRRAEQMLSSALKFGTTDHLAPHPKQLEGNQQLGIPKLNWKDGDTAHNIRELAKVTSEVTTKEFGEIADLTYNPESKRFERPDGTEFTDADFTKLAERGRADAEAAVMAATGRNANALGPSKRALLRRTHTAGSTTLKRAVIARQLASPEGGKLAGLLAGIGERGAEYPAGKSLPNLKRVLYSKRDPQTETPAFKKWFGDSKVVDSEGKPLVVYHGTDADVNRFDNSRLGASTGAKSAHVGHFFVDRPDVATSYAHYAAVSAPIRRAIAHADALEAKAQRSGKGADWDAHSAAVDAYEALEREVNSQRDRGQNIIPAYLSLQNPASFDAGGESFMDLQDEINAFLKEAKRAGRDGVIFENLDDDPGFDGRAGTHYVVFRPEQIKSAIGNSGDFDPANPSILKSASAPKPKTERLTDDQVKSAKADTESRVASHWGRSAVNKLKTRGRVEFITKQEVVDRGLQTMAELDGVDGFFDPESGKAYVIVDSGAQSADLPGVLSHEVFHANAEQFLGTDGFKRLKEAFRKLKSRDKDIAAAYKRVPSDTSAAHVDEEGLAYLAQEAPKHRLSERLTDEAKLFLNRLGIPLDWLNAHAAAVRKIAALNLKDAANRGGVVSFNKDGVKYQKVFHGTPHRGIEKTGFSLQKIGTGEGAQAYGYGMYFAGNKDIAEHYRKTLSAQNDQKSNYRGLPTAYRVDGKDIARGNPDYAAADIVHIMQNYGPVEAGWLTREIGARGLDLADTRKRVKRLSSKTIGTVSGGQLYHAEIPEDSDLLDYDKPISRQPEKVRDALVRVLQSTGVRFVTEGRRVDAIGSDGRIIGSAKRGSADSLVDTRLRAFFTEYDASGDTAYKQIAQRFEREDAAWDAIGKTPNDVRNIFQAASEALSAAGIPGLRYLDGTSRGNGEGSHNYVIWDETLLTPEKAQITPYYSKRDKPKPKVTGARPEELIEVRKQISSFRTLIKCLGG